MDGSKKGKAEICGKSRVNTRLAPQRPSIFNKEKAKENIFFTIFNIFLHEIEAPWSALF
jgi:hypothetical protein